MYEERVGKRVKLKVPSEPFTDMKEHKLHFNQDMVAAANKDPYVDILCTYHQSYDGEVWRLKAKFSNGVNWYVVPSRFDLGPCLFL